MENKSIVYLAGSGPGDQDLLSVKTQELILQADFIVYDNLVNPMMLLGAKKDCKKIFVGKIPGQHSKTQDEINAILCELAANNCGKIVRLKGGDPFVFGRGGEEVLALEKANINYQLVPGITSAIAALELAGIPVTHRREARSFHVITGHTAEDEDESTRRFTEYAKLSGTLIFLMGIKNLPLIASQLLEGGKNPETPVSIVENGSTVLQRRINGTLGTITQIAVAEKAKNPAIIVVGQVAAFSMTCKNLPLQGKKICITGTASFIKKVAAPLKEMGALVFSAPVIETVLNEGSFSAIPSFEEIPWLVFTSSNGVRLFFEHLKKTKTDLRKLSNVKFAAVGSGTADCLQEYGFCADFIPAGGFTVEKLSEEFVQKYGSSIVKKVVVLRAEEGSKDLDDVFKKNKIEYLDIPLYSTKKNDFVLDILENQIPVFDIITFASSSGVKAFFEIPDAKKMMKPDVKLFCIGNKTKKTLEDFADSSIISTAQNFTAEGLIETILKQR